MARARKQWWRAPQNPAATHYVYENDQVKGGLRFTLLAIALEMPRRCTTTHAMLLAPLRKWTRFTEQQTRNHQKELVRMGEIACHRLPGTKRVRYEMLKLAGPLFVAPTGDEDPKKIFGSRGEDPKKIFGSSPLSRSVASTNVGVVPTTNPPAAAVLNMHAFVEWWNAETPKREFRYGQTPSPIDLDVDGQVVLDLFKRGQPLDLVQACAELLWTITPDANPNSNRSWCATSDHNVRVLRRHQKFFEGELRRRADAGRASNVWSEVLKRVKDKIDSHSFHAWWHESILLEDRGETLVVSLKLDAEQHEHAAAWIRRHYDVVLKESVAAVRPGAIVEFCSELEMATARTG